MAVTGVRGEIVRTVINHIDIVTRQPILGAVFSVVLADKPDGSQFPVTVTEVGDGVYEVEVTTLVTDPHGEWLLVLRADNGDRYEEVFDILDRRPIVLPVAPVPQHGATRQQIRRAVATQLGDLTIAVATNTGTTSILTDTINLTREAHAFDGMQMYCADAQAVENIGAVTTVVGSNPAQRSVSFTPSLLMPTMPGDVFEMYNYRGVGWRLEDYNRAINDAILRGGQEHGPIPMSMEVPAYVRNSDIPIPEEFAYFSSIEVYRYDHWHKVPFRYYEADPYECTVRFRGPYVYGADGQKLRIKGHREPELLFTDDATTSIPTEWVVHEVIAILVQHDAMMGGNNGRDRLLQFSRSGADGRRPTIVTTYAPNTIKLRRG